MATNQFFRSSYFSTDKDQVLLNNLNREAIQVQGIDVKYIRREFVNYDKLFGEDQSSKFENSYDIEMYVKSVDSFGGDGKFLSKFGLEIRDEITFSVNRDRFTAEVIANEPDISRPMEGDLIWVMSAIDKRARVFEITYVNSEEVYYQLGRLYTWEIQTKVFEYAGETFETGVDEIDVLDEYKIDRILTMTAGTGDFAIGETVTIAETSSSAVVIFWNPLNQQLTVSNIVGQFDTGRVVGQTSLASWDILSIDTYVDSVSSNSDNDFIKDKEIDIVDFSEKNPFSE